MCVCAQVCICVSMGIALLGLLWQHTQSGQLKQQKFIVAQFGDKTCQTKVSVELASLRAIGEACSNPSSWLTDPCLLSWPLHILSRHASVSKAPLFIRTLVTLD